MNIEGFTALGPHDTIATGTYCVGGAIALYDYNKPMKQLIRQIKGIQDWDTHFGCDERALHFPVWQVLASYLRVYNPSLDQEAAMVYSRNILEANDEGNFDRAWIIAQWALAHEEDDPVPSSAELGAEVIDEPARTNTIQTTRQILPTGSVYGNETR
jgi:hypothetical protein